MIDTLMTTLAQADLPSSASSAEIHSVFDFLLKGGWMMIPIGACSLVAFSVIIERLVSLRRTRVVPPGFMQGLRTLMEQGPRSRAQAVEYCRSNDSALAGVLAVAIKRLGEPQELLEKHIQEAGERQAMKLRKHLRVLSVIGSVAPLLGLLGTITGMITAFQTVAVSGEALGRTELLARGIYEAMITTAAGLVVAIPVLVCYHWLSGRVDGLVTHIDGAAEEFMEEHGGVSSSHTPATINPAINNHHRPLADGELLAASTTGATA